MKKKNITKSMALLLLTILVAGACIGTTLAYITDGTEAVTNTMTPGTVTTAVKETFDGTTKSNVQIQNTGNTDAYIRAAVIVTWQKAVTDETTGKTSYLVYGEAPKSTDYTITWWNDEAAGELKNDSWIKGSDGFYYHKASVAPGATTDTLIAKCELNDNVTPPTDYKLCVEIIGSGIQAKGTDGTTPVVVKEWLTNAGLALSGGVIVAGE